MRALKKTVCNRLLLCLSDELSLSQTENGSSGFVLQFCHFMLQFYHETIKQNMRLLHNCSWILCSAFLLQSRWRAVFNPDHQLCKEHCTLLPGSDSVEATYVDLGRGLIMGTEERKNRIICEV